MTSPSRHRVLVVDDEPQMLVALEDLLCDDFEVVTMESAERALHLVENDHDIAVVISDQRMPKMTGDELFTRLDGQSAATRILVTGYADLSAVIRAVNSGKIFGYVTKPWNPDDLRFLVQKGAEYFRLGRELVYERQLLHDLMENIPEGIFFKDTELRFQRVNRVFAEMMNERESALFQGKCLREAIPGSAEALATEEREAQLLADGKSMVDVVRTVTHQGERRWVSESKAPIRSPEGTVLGLVGITRDVTERVKSQDRIARLTRIHAVLGSITSAIVRISDRDRLMLETCRIAVDVGRFTVGAAIGIRGEGEAPEIIALQHRSGAIADAESVTSRLMPGTILRRVVAEGRPVVVNDAPGEGLGAAGGAASGYRSLAVFPLIVDGRTEIAFALFSDVSGLFDSDELKLLEELAANLSFALAHIAQTAALDLLSYYDTLTRLPNRDLLRDRVTQAIAASRSTEGKLAVVLFDIDRFRHVNETLGWPAGDELLAQVARRLAQNLAPEHTLARCGSNAFALLVTPVEEESNVALLVESHAQEAARRAYSVHGTELLISLRAGIAVFPSDGQGPDALLGNAETALKSARSTGQRYAFYAPRMNARVAEKLDLETRLRRAIENEEFLLHYQPKVNLKTGKLSGLEALIRWREPSGSLVSPAQFIPVLEDTGLILDVGRWVMETAAAQYAAWVDGGLAPPRIAVNVSALQLAQDEFLGSLDSVLRKIPRAAEGLDLEITESVFVDDMTGNVEKLRAARARGLEVAIDDFGTGYSSLGYLSRLPIDALKIDRSFVIRMTENAQDMSIVTAIITLAHSLDLKVIAEGVETQEQARLLNLLRCDQLQGYLLAKPQSADKTAALLEAGTPLLERAASGG